MDNDWIDGMKPDHVGPGTAQQAVSSVGGRIWIFGPFVLLMLPLAYVLVVNAWVVDDAYITFRTIDNFIHGHGLTWNIEERVQAYTHPLWMLLLTVVCSATSEFYYTNIVISLVVSLCSIICIVVSFTDTFRSNLLNVCVYIALLISSKSYIDYTSSGLENSLSYLIASVFIMNLMNTKRFRNIVHSKTDILAILASVAFICRPDTVIIYAPCVTYKFIKLLNGRSLARSGFSIVYTTLPLIIWTVFSIVYYGYPLPNTAYAKDICNGVTNYCKTMRGLEYAMNGMMWDTLSHLSILMAMFISVTKRNIQAVMLMLGVFAYYAFIIINGASATHMSGRLFSVPVFVAITVIVYLLESKKVAVFLSVMSSIYIIWSPVSSVKFGTAAYHPYPQQESFLDTKYYVYREGAALLNWRPNVRLPNHVWFQYGIRTRERPEKVHIGGAYGSEAIGYLGFAAGPEKFIIDRLGLTDPLLSRLPASTGESCKGWRSGHFRRDLPAGYVESVARATNVIRDEKIHKYYDVIRNITRGPLFRMDRFRDIWQVNVGGGYPGILWGCCAEPASTIQEGKPLD
jgi:arabinofuranosyltransferase